MHPPVGPGFPAITFDAIRAEIERMTPRGVPSPTSVDLPVSSAVKRALRRAEKEANESGQEAIGIEHLLLGLLAEDDSIVPGILRKYGIDRESVLREIPANPPSRQSAPEQPGKAPPDRESLRALVDSLPDGALQAAHRALEHMQTWPPVRPPLPARITELTKEMGERARRGLKPGTMGGGGAGGSWTTDAEGRIRTGRYSSSRSENGADCRRNAHLSRWPRDHAHRTFSFERRWQDALLYAGNQRSRSVHATYNRFRSFVNPVN